MCGIAGLVFRQTDHLNWGSDAFNQLHHRGPDDHGWLTYGDSAERGRQPLAGSSRLLLLHRRLSILDLSEAGWQPMQSPDGRLHIAFNGEIYNFLELRQELKQLGHRFASDSDTEVLLAAWAQWGTDCLNRLVGMFAFALLDVQGQTLHLVRDFFGIKPLYYAAWNDGLAFASEIPPLLELPQVSRRGNPERLFSYLRFGLTDNGGETLFADIRQLPAAHYLRVDLKTPQSAQPKRYWSLTLQAPLELSFQQAAEQVRETFLENVRLHLRSDVPVGAALSGGIDSSAIVMAMRHLEPDLELHTFSYIPEQADISEERWIDLVGGAAKAQVHKVQPTAQELVADLDHLVRVQGEPFGSTSIYAQHRVFGLARQAGIKVMLDGQGADELLAGYFPHYNPHRLVSLLKQGRLSKALAAARQMGDSEGLKKAARFFLPEALTRLARRLTGKEYLPEWLNEHWFEAQGANLTLEVGSRGSQAMREELLDTLTRTSVPMLLRYEDRNSMAHSIESRVPFLTPKLTQLLLNLPEEYLIAPDGTTKSVFRAAMRGIVPDAVLDRKDKIGFQTPEQRWLETLAPWVEAHLGDLGAVPAINPAPARAEWQAIRSGQKPFSPRVWRWINAAVWAKSFNLTW
ncbi:MAG: asparagine synthase (glutamine-hydrolyzing) [Meiothermus sp.]|nr:asparagine synthase (glutamine-hydrolyzing) [Meiothermus sp.]